jgi:hypothetical protein
MHRHFIDKPIRLVCFYFTGVVMILILSGCSKGQTHDSKIDRFALVNRHNVILHAPDTLGALSVGNGEFAFTADVSGLQTFPEAYENGIPLGTQSQWGWHSIPQNKTYSLADVMTNYESCDTTHAPYAIQHAVGQAGEATRALRINPHRLQLGMVGLILIKESGEEVKLGDLTGINQQLDLWSGKIESMYTIEGVPVHVVLYSHQQEDQIAVKIVSPLIEKGRLRIKIDFPYGKDCHVCPGYDFESTGKHQSAMISKGSTYSVIKRTLDTTAYFAHVNWSDNGKLKATPTKHHFELYPDNVGDAFEFTVLFNRDSATRKSDYKSTAENSILHWKKFWESGGAVDFSLCTDKRAPELERRVVLSQYLTKIQCAGSMPPQETGLTMNSWYGKFHLEMHWWHAAHFGLWDRIDQLEKSMQWYTDVMPKAIATAKQQGYAGARWQKMTGPQGAESPSGIGAFIIWQQPHPIYFAELFYRADPTPATLEKYKDVVFNTADFMASFVKLREGKYHLCHPLVPAQEIFKATETDDPAYELQYWYYGLAVAQQWRIRSGMEANNNWAAVLADLAPLVISNNFYLPNATTPNAYTDDQYRNDHPAVVGILGFLPMSHRIDTTIMANTFDEIMRHWKWETTWGWDYPLLAMTAARLNKPAQAIDALMLNVQKNTYLVNGHNYQDDRLRLYLPGNGGILSAIAMMCAGWDGNKRTNPGFPTDGTWNVKWEGLKAMP